MKTLTENQYDSLRLSDRVNVSQLHSASSYVGYKRFKRKLDGLTYVIQPVEDYLRIFATCKLRLMLHGEITDVRRKAIVAVLVKRGAMLPTKRKGKK